MSGQTIGTIVGTVIGSYFGYPQLGAVIGGMIGATQDKPEAPDPGDLTGPKVQLGGQFGRPYGVVRLPVSWISIDAKYTVNEGDSGGKGSPDEPTATTFAIDALGLVCDSARVIGVTREWVNKKLVIVRTPPPEASPLVNVAYSIVDDYYGSVLDLFGGPTQMPAPLYEARVGTADALAYRDMFTREYAQINCGQTKAIPAYEVEVITKGTETRDVILLSNLNGTPGSTAAPDTSSFAQTIASNFNMEQSSASPAFGATAYVKSLDVDAVAFALVYSASGGNWNTSQGLTLEGRYVLPPFDPAKNGGIELVSVVSNIGSIGVRYFQQFGTFELYAFGLESSAGGDIAGWTHVAVDWNPATRVASLYVGGSLVTTVSDSIATNTAVSFTQLRAIEKGSGSVGFAAVDGVRITKRRRYTAPFTPPGIEPTDDGLLSPAAELLSDVILAELSRHPEFDPGSVDVSDIEDIEVESYYAVGSPMDTIPDLCRIYYVDVVPGNPIKFLKRGRASIAAIPWVETGVGIGGPGKAFEGLKQGNDDEIPGVVGINFVDLNRDHNANFLRGDRLTTEGPDITKVTTRVGMRPDMAKGRAITATLLNRQARHTAEFALSNRYAAAEPGDCYTVADREGNSYRLRIPALSYSDTVKSCKWHLEDASAYVASGITDLTDEPTVTIPGAVPVSFTVANLPALRDEDTTQPGVYAVTSWDSSDSIVAAVYSGPASMGAFPLQGTLSRSAVVGTMTDALGDFTGGWTWDNTNSAEVVLQADGMSIASSTYAAMYADPSGQLAAIGDDGRWEIVGFRLATLTAARTYTLSSMLRGLKGTEWAMGLHEPGDRFILLANNGMRYIPQQVSDLGAERYYKAGEIGRPVSPLPTQALTTEGANLKPLSVVRLETERDGSDVIVTWERRSRLSVPLYGDPLLSDAPETYVTELRNGGTVVATQTVTSRSVTYPYTGGYTVAVMQRNALAGNGYEAEITL